MVVPTEDVEQVTEFPFRRYPGAVLKSLGQLSDYDLLNRKDVVRSYVVAGASLQEIGSHYESELRKLGIEDARAAVDGLSWYGGAPKAGIEAFGVSSRSLGLIPGSGLGIYDLKRVVPHVFEGLPVDVGEILVCVYFASPEARLQYLSRVDQERHEALARVPPG